MSLSRRKVLIFGGASAVVAAGASWGLLANPSMKRAAAPWFAAGQGFADPRLNALSYAILAPNPHNRQPWEFALVGEDQVDVRIDLNKRLPETDPFDRQITIGFGCMLELFRQAAAELGYIAVISPFPDGEGGERLGEGRIASIRLTANAATRDPLFAAVLERRSTKEPYTEQLVEQASLDAMASAVVDGVSFGASNAPELTDRLAANAWEAWKIEYETDATRRESIDLMRIGNDAAVTQPDGIDLAGPMMSAAHAVGLITKETLDTPGTTAFEAGYDLYRPMVDSTKAWVWLVTQQNTRIGQLNTGASWVRLNLAAQREGLAVHPWSQPLQEFPEMAKPYAELRDLLAPEGGTVQMFARVGYGPAVDASPRWPLEAKLVDA